MGQAVQSGKEVVHAAAQREEVAVQWYRRDGDREKKKGIQVDRESVPARRIIENVKANTKYERKPGSAIEHQEVNAHVNALSDQVRATY